MFRGFNSASTREERDCDSLPETEKDDQFNGGDFQQRFVLADVVLDLDVELDQAVHRDGDGDCFENHDPYVRECWTERFETIKISSLGYDGHDSEEDADEAVLEYRDPDHLRHGLVLALSAKVPALTLNQVRPLCGVLSQPFSTPPVHFWKYFMGQIHLFGLIVRK